MSRSPVASQMPNLQVPLTPDMVHAVPLGESAQTHAPVLFTQLPVYTLHTGG